MCLRFRRRPRETCCSPLSCYRWMHEECLIINPDSPRTPTAPTHVVKTHRLKVTNRLRKRFPSSNQRTERCARCETVKKKGFLCTYRIWSHHFTRHISLRGEVALMPRLRPSSPPPASHVNSQNWQLVRISGQLHPISHLINNRVFLKTHVDAMKFKHLPWNYSSCALFFISYKCLFLFNQSGVSLSLEAPFFFFYNCHLWIYTL